jgi:hypothetical protein
MSAVVLVSVSDLGLRLVCPRIPEPASLLDKADPRSDSKSMRTNI